MLMLKKPPSSSSGTSIIGGSFAAPNQYLFTVGLRQSKSGLTYCGGALISPTHVITAAHCETPKYLALGTHFSKGTFGGEYIALKSMKRHPEFNKGAFLANDLAIIELEQPSSARIISINITAAAEEDEATVCGWGYTSENGAQSDIKLTTRLNLISNTQCSELLNEPLHPSMMCAGYLPGGKDACQKDSGGPLFTKNEELIGIVSWGLGCGQASVPGVYSRLATAVDFVKKYAPTAKIF